jgi:hypothetical protein
MKTDTLSTFFADFLEPNGRLCSRLSGFADRLPSLLREAVLEYVCWRGLSPDTMAWPSFYRMLPFWAQCDLGGSVGDDCLEIAYANACLGHMTLIEDELTDEAVQASGPRLMAANALALEAHLSYASLFSRTSPFWDYYIPLLQNSWNNLLLEKKMHIDASERLTELDDELQKTKVNPLKVATIAVALLNQRDEIIPQFLHHLDHWQLACQRLDDLADWRVDLRASNYTRILVLAGAIGNQAEARMQEFLSSKAFGKYLDEVPYHYRMAQMHCPRSNGYLDQHITDLIDRLATLRKSYDAFAEQADRLKSWSEIG